MRHKKPNKMLNRERERRAREGQQEHGQQEHQGDQSHPSTAHGPGEAMRTNTRSDVEDAL